MKFIANWLKTKLEINNFELYFIALPLLLINLWYLSTQLILLTLSLWSGIFVLLRPLLHKFFNNNTEFNFKNISGKKILFSLAIIFFLFFEIHTQFKILYIQRKFQLSGINIWAETNSFFYSLGVGLFAAIILWGSSFYIGKLFVNISGGKKFLTDIYEKILINTALGIIINTFIFTVVLWFFNYSLVIITTYLILCTIKLGLDNYKWLITYCKYFLNTKHNFTIQRIDLVPQLSLLFFVFIFIVLINRNYSYGSDALRTYLQIPQYIAETQTLPNKDFNTFYPFVLEIFISPAIFIGGVSGGHIALLLIGMLHLLILPIFLKDRIRIKHIALLIGFVSFINYYYFQFKIDILATMLCLSIFVLYYKYLNNPELRASITPLIIIISETTILAKLNYAFFILPMVLIIGFYEIKNIKKDFLIILTTIFLSILLISPWIYFYSRDIPYTQYLNSKLLTIIPDNIAASHNKINPCYYNMIDLEFENFYRKDKSSILHISKYLKEQIETPAFLFNISEIGIIYLNLLSLGLLLSVYVFFTDKNKFRGNFPINKTTILVSTPIIISLIAAQILYSFLPWYVAPQLIILVVFIIYLYGESKWLDYIYKFYFPLYVFIFLNLSINLYYFSSLNKKSDYGEFYQHQKGDYNAFANTYEVSKILNSQPNDNILFASGATFLNISYFIDNYFTRVFYADYLKTNLEESIKKYSISFIVVNKPLPDLKPESCTAKYLMNFQTELNEIKNSKKVSMETIMDNDVFIVYKIIR